MTLSKHLFAGLFVSLAAVACTVGGPDPSPSSSSSSSSSGGSSSSKGGTSTGDPKQDQSPTDTKPSGATSVSCEVADDCGYWFCDCKASNGDVTPVNSRNCKNGWCMDASTSCPSACSAFGKTWTGTAGGGPDQK